jgi:hypothetical protein
MKRASNRCPIKPTVTSWKCSYFYNSLKSKEEISTSITFTFFQWKPVLFAPSCVFSEFLISLLLIFYLYCKKEPLKKRVKKNPGSLARQNKSEFTTDFV